MRNPGGRARVSGPAGVAEIDSFTCRHCQVVTFVRPKQRAADIGGICKVCMGLICVRCVGLMRCDPIEKKLERAEARYHALRSYGLA